jgi:hypothetical protein
MAARRRTIRIHRQSRRQSIVDCFRARQLKRYLDDTEGTYGWLELLLHVRCQVEAETRDVEKPDLKLGFIKLTRHGSVGNRLREGLLRDEGLFVKLEPQSD